MSDHPRTSGRRRRDLATVLAAVATVVLAAAGLAAVSLSASPAEAGTLLSDNFEGGSLDAWSKSGGTWSVATDGTRVLQQSNLNSDLAQEFAGETSWTDYTVTVRVKPVAFEGTDRFVGLAARASSSSTYYRLALYNSGRAELQAVQSGDVDVLAWTTQSVTTNTWYTLKITVSGKTISGWVNGSSIGSATSSVSTAGRIGLQTLHATASFDDVAVSSSGPATTPPTTSPPPGAWPASKGNVSITAPIRVSGTYDGGLKTHCCLGDQSQTETQDPMFILAPGATLQNVIIGSPAGDGVHCTGSCTLKNVWWTDVGDDAATFKGTSASDTYLVDGGGARSAANMVFQHNGPGTATIQNFYVEGFGKLYRSCGNCTTQYKRTVTITNVRAVTPGVVLAGINTNYGDTARFTGNNVDSGIELCWRYTGNNAGSEPRKTGSGLDGTYCVGS